jgi:hypothetical protein
MSEATTRAPSREGRGGHLTDARARAHHQRHLVVCEEMPTRDVVCVAVVVILYGVR